MTTFEAKGITVLRLTLTPDRSGEVIPPACHLDLPSSVHVHFDPGNGVEDIVGSARLYRKGNLLLADLRLVSHWSSLDALAAISELHPAVCGEILAVEAMTIQRLKVTSIVLAAGNTDPKIQSIGNRLRIVDGRGLN